MSKIGYIYKITSPTNKIYIGKTTRLNDRISSYRTSNGISEQKMIFSSIKKHGWENHKFEVIDEAPVDKLSDLEIHYIQQYNSFHYKNPDGMNLTLGGEGCLGRKDTFETIQKRANSIKGRKHSEETKKLMSSLKKGKITNEETIKNRNNTRLLKLIEKHESILQIDKITNKIIKEWTMLPKDIAKILNICDTNIIKCLNNRKEHTLGFIWRYKK